LNLVSQVIISPLVDESPLLIHIIWRLILLHPSVYTRLSISYAAGGPYVGGFTAAVGTAFGFSAAVGTASGFSAAVGTASGFFAAEGHTLNCVASIAFVG
jgi:hypothetical protein